MPASEMLLALLLEAQGRQKCANPGPQRKAEGKSLITITLTGFFPPGPELPRGTEEFFYYFGCGPIPLPANLERDGTFRELSRGRAEWSRSPADGLGPVPHSG